MKSSVQVVEDLPWRWNTQGVIFIIGGLGYMFDAWDVLLAPYLLPLLSKQWGLSTVQLGLFGSAGLIGMGIGSIVWGTVADKVGRKRAFSLTVLVYAFFTLIGALSPNYAVLIISRLLAGFGLGGCLPVDYAMVSEFLPYRNRGRALTALELFWPVGATLCGFVATAMLPFHNWRLLLLVMVAPALLLFWVRIAIPESPMFLAKAGRKDEARAVIDRLIKRTGARVGEWSFTDSNSPVTAKPLSPLALVRGAGGIWKFNWRITLVSWLLLGTVLLEYYGVTSWLPAILTKSGYSSEKAFMATTAVTAIGIFGGIISALLVEKIGRKPLIAIGALVSACAMVAFTLVITEPGRAQACLLLFGLANNLVIPALYCYIPELYPTLLRGTGFGWASAVSRAVAGLVPLFFGAWLWPVLGLTRTFEITGLLVLIAILVMAFLAPETRGMRLEQAKLGMEDRIQLKDPEPSS
jgi:MFS transporter, putative metabolite:H+ symporter